MLDLWSSGRSGPFYTLLYFSFSVGTVFGPTIPSLMPIEKLQEGDPYTRIQKLYLCLGSLLLFVAVSFVLLAFAERRIPKEEEEESNGQSKEEEAASASGEHRRMSKILLLSFVTVLFGVANGVQFAFTNFLPTFAEQTGRDESVGSRAATLYFASSCVLRLVSVFAIAKVSALLLLVADFVLLFAGTAVLFVCRDSDALLLAGVFLVGAGIATVFPSGVVWVGRRVRVDERHTTVFLVSTSVGAQLLKVPIAKYIEGEPMTLFYALAASGAVMAATFLAAVGVAMTMEKRPKNGGDQEKAEAVKADVKAEAVLFLPAAAEINENTDKSALRRG